MAPPKSTVVAWNFVQKDGFNLSCQLCGHNFTGTLTKAVDHFLGISNGSGGGVEACTKITDEQKATVEKDHSNSQMQKQKRVNKRQRIEREIAMSSSNTINSVSNIGGSSSTAPQAKTGGPKTLNQFWKLVEKQEVDDVVAEYFYACAIPFNVVRSPYFKNVIKKAIDFGKGYVPPGSEALRTTLLKRAKDRVTRKLADIKESWKLTGCTILSDGWSDLCHRPLNQCACLLSSRGTFLEGSKCNGSSEDIRFPERNWSSFDHIHSKKRNRLSSGRLEDLVYVRSNLQLALKNVAKESSNSSTPWIDPVPNATMDDVDLYIDSDINTDREFTDESGAEASSGFTSHTALDDIELFDITSGQQEHQE